MSEQFGSSSALALLRVAAERAGASAEGARLLRFGSNAIYRLADAPVVVRVGRGAEVVPIAERELAVARWLAEGGYPAARVWEGAEQPVIVDGHPVTFWEAVEGSEARPSFSDLGRLLRRLHGLAPPPFGLPAFSPFGKMRDRIGRVSDVDDQDRQFLAERCDRIEEALAELEPALGSSLFWVGRRFRLVVGGCFYGRGQQTQTGWEAAGWTTGWGCSRRRWESRRRGG